jgi:metal-responsive CopG/Arc/MetJ family transcriptional regulator
MHMEWFGCAIPKTLADRIQKIMNHIGFKSVSDAVTKAVQDRLPSWERQYEEVKEAMRDGTIKEGGDEGEL